MAKDVVGLMRTKAFKKLRKVKGQIHELSSRKKRLLRASSLDDFFDLHFLRRAGLQRSEISLAHLGKTVKQFLELWGFKKVGEVEEGCNLYLFAQLDGVGDDALAFLLDLQTAFGLRYRLEVVDFDEPKPKGGELADRLGLP